MKQSDYNKNQPYDSELLTQTAKVLSKDQRIVIYSNGQINVRNWRQSTDIIIGRLV